MLAFAVWAIILWCCDAKLLLDEGFSCAEMGCNTTHGITNYSYWR